MATLGVTVTPAGWWNSGPFYGFRYITPDPENEVNYLAGAWDVGWESHGELDPPSVGGVPLVALGGGTMGHWSTGFHDVLILVVEEGAAEEDFISGITVGGVDRGPPSRFGPVYTDSGNPTGFAAWVWDDPGGSLPPAFTDVYTSTPAEALVTFAGATQNFWTNFRSAYEITESDPEPPPPDFATTLVKVEQVFSLPSYTYNPPRGEIVGPNDGDIRTLHWTNFAEEEELTVTVGGDMRTILVGVTLDDRAELTNPDRAVYDDVADITGLTWNGVPQGPITNEYTIEVTFRYNWV